MKRISRSDPGVMKSMLQVTEMLIRNMEKSCIDVFSVSGTYMACTIIVEKGDKPTFYFECVPMARTRMTYH